MKIFIGLGENEEDDSSCYINIFNIDYVLKINTEGDQQTTIRFKGSDNQISTPVPIKELMRRIDNALNSFENKKIKEEITRASLMDLD